MFSASTLRAGGIQVITWTGLGGNASASNEQNWNPVGVPSPDHNVLLPGGFIFGIPQTINIGGSVLEVRLLEATNHASPSPYTFINGTIEIYLTGGNSILTRNTGGAVTVDADIVFPDVATGPRFNVEPTAPPIVVNGNITTSGSSSTTVVLELTSRNLALPSSVTVNGVISDTGNRPLALTAGFAPDSENHRGTVTLTGANTYRGPTIVNGAVLVFNSIGNVDASGIASALGAPRNTADGTIRLGAIDASSGTHVAGTLRYTGTAAAQTDRAIALSADGAGGVIESSGGGPLVFTAPEFQLDATGGKTLTLGGTNAEANEIQADLVEQGGPLALLKEGDGTWILSGTNSYTGGTSLNGGTLAVSADNALGNASGGLDFDGGTLRFDAAFNLADTRAISLGAGGGTLDTNGNNTTISQAISGSGSGSFTKTGAGNLELTGPGTLPGNTFVDGGQLEITGGGLVTNTTGFIGVFTGSTGAVTVSGTDSAGNPSPSTWTNSGALFVGYVGDGTLDVTGGGLVTNSFDGFIGRVAGSTGAVTVSGTDSAGNPSPSTWTNSGQLFVGSLGNGTLDVTGGGLVTNTAGFIGASTGSTGAVTVSGTDSAGNPSPSTWTNSDELRVGSLGNGTLDVTGGGLVTNSFTGYIGWDTGSIGAVTVSGTDSAGNPSPSTWTNSSQLFVGNLGNGTLDITGGGLVTNSIGYIGDFTGSTGAVTVSGTDSAGNPSTWTNSGNLRVGESGNGRLDVTGGGLVTNSIGYIGDFTGSTGAVTVSGTDSAGNRSTWTNSNNLRVGESGNGRLDVTGGGLVTNRDGTIGSDTGSTGAVTVSGTDSAGIPSTWTNSRELRVGTFGDGRLDVTGGGLVSVGDLLAIDADADGDSFLNMSTGGMLALYGGNADDSLSQFLDLVQGTKAIRYWDSSLADWRPITVATPGEDYTLEYLTTGDLAGYTLLTVGQLPGLPGDYNGNGVVDAADYTTWRDRLGQTFTLTNEDPDTTPGQVTQEDYNFWKATFGATAGTGASSTGASPSLAAVPEPASATLIAMASLLLLNRGRLGCRDDK
jgi:T5SS/PEP-CTERM-associated repeat protein/autotransporter-associated beta strand protein